MKIKKFNDFGSEKSEQINENYNEYGVVNIHIDGEGFIYNQVKKDINKVLKNLQGERHIFVDGKEVSWTSNKW